MQRQRLRVIAGAGGDDAALPLFGRESQQAAHGAAFLERPRKLEVFELEVNLTTREARECGAFAQRRAPYPPADPSLRTLNVGNCEHLAEI